VRGEMRFLGTLAGLIMIGAAFVVFAEVIDALGGVSGIYETLKMFFTDGNVPLAIKVLAIGAFLGAILLVVVILTGGGITVVQSSPPTEEEIVAMAKAYAEEMERKAREKKELAQLIAQVEDPELRRKLVEKIMDLKEREYKEGYAEGYDEGYTHGFGSGYAAGSD